MTEREQLWRSACMHWLREHIYAAPCTAISAALQIASLAPDDSAAPSHHWEAIGSQFLRFEWLRRRNCTDEAGALLDHCISEVIRLIGAESSSASAQEPATLAAAVQPSHNLAATVDPPASPPSDAPQPGAPRTVQPAAGASASAPGPGHPPTIAPDWRTCRKCGKPRPLSEFEANKDRANGRTWECKPCARARRRASNAKHKAAASTPARARAAQSPSPLNLQERRIAAALRDGVDLGPMKPCPKCGREYPLLSYRRRSNCGRCDSLATLRRAAMRAAASAPQPVPSPAPADAAQPPPHQSPSLPAPGDPTTAQPPAPEAPPLTPVQISSTLVRDGVVTETDAPAAHQTVLLPARSEKVLPPPSERAFTPAAWSIDQPITAGFSAAIAEAYRNCESTVLLYPQRERHGVTRQFLSAAGVPIADASAAAVVLVHRAARQARSDIAVSVFRDKLAGNGHRRPADDAAPIGAGDD